jgi:hypothetical protein
MNLTDAQKQKAQQLGEDLAKQFDLIATPPDIEDGLHTVEDLKAVVQSFDDLRALLVKGRDQFKAMLEEIEQDVVTR